MSKGYRHASILQAYSGNFEPLARYLEAGGELKGGMREFLIALLRDQIRFKRGNRRTFAQRQLDRQIGEEISLFEDALGLGRSEAIRRYLDQHPTMNSETLKSILRRHARDHEEALRRVEQLPKYRGPSPGSTGKG